MEIEDILIKFTESFEIENNRFSCLKIALNDARKLTGRNINNGNRELNILQSHGEFLNPNSFIGLINYLLILDLIGEVFELEGFYSKKTTKIYLALKQFGDSLTDKEIDTIVALRNSLAHNYGLINIPKPSEFETKLHKFTLLNMESDFLIKFPTIPWDGNFSNKLESSSTEISVLKLIELIEKTYINLLRELNINKVKLKLKGGKDELFSRFTIRY